MERYDRQVRLWGEHGQNKCCTSKVCLIGCDSLGIEILKGLCLAGVGSFTILDSHKLIAEDVGCSFLPAASIGENRAESAKSLLLDINPDVKGEVFPLEVYLPHVTTTAQSMLDPRIEEDDSINKDLEFWKQFNCVIFCGTHYISQIRRLSKLCWSLNTPLLICKSIGFYGIIRIQMREHIVLDTHPEWRPPNHDTSKPDSLTITSAESVCHEYDGELYDCKREDDDEESIAIYVSLKVLEQFFSNYGRFPGLCDDQVEADVGKVKECVKQMFGKATCQFKTLNQCLYELCRYGGAEIHATSAFLGGCAAQEIIKIVTNQYVPLNDTLVYNAMSATTRAFKFSELFTRL